MILEMLGDDQAILVVGIHLELVVVPNSTRHEGTRAASEMMKT
jgi:hypothetical protein